jgi:hypothetical protein
VRPTTERLLQRKKEVNFDQIGKKCQSKSGLSGSACECGDRSGFSFPTWAG